MFIPSWATAPQGTFGEVRFVDNRHCARQFLQLPLTETSRARLVRDIEISNRDHRRNVFFGLNPRIREGGKATDVACSTALFLDIDEEPLAVWKELVDKGLSPTSAVCSGHGLHLYYILDRPYPVHETAELAKKLCYVANSDPVWSPAQSPRLPGTLNWKESGAAVPCYVIAELSAGTEWTIAALRSSALSSVTLPLKIEPEEVHADLSHLPSFVVSEVGLPDKLRWVFDHYEGLDRSRADAALTVWAVDQGWEEDKIAMLLGAPRRSKFRERIQRSGMAAGKRYLAATIAWAKQRRMEGQ